MFLTQPKITRITQPILDRVMTHSLGDDIVLDGRSLQLMYDIQHELSIFEPIEDDEARLFWLEIPRGTALEWKLAHDEHEEPTEEEELSLREEFTHETEWIFLTTSTYRDFTHLRISDRDHKYRIFCNEDRSSESVKWDMEWFLQPLLELVKERVKEIARDPEAYHMHLEDHLPHRQRSGKIRSRELNRILNRHLEVENRDYCIQVMKELIRGQEVYEQHESDWQKHNVPAPFDQMTIRTFCHYYRIADALFFKDSDYAKRHNTQSENDVEYYSNHGLHDKLDQYDVDSPADYHKFAKDHYGELGLSRMNVGATDFYVKGKWIVTFGFSYSAYLLEGLKIALALYETGAPVIFYDAENVLHALEESGWVRLSPFTFHDYIKGGDDEGVYSLPFPEECDMDEEITSQQYDEIIRLAHWEPLDRLQLDHTIPLDNPLYDAIREEVSEPQTISTIRHLIEKKYSLYLQIAQDDETKQYYPMPLRFEEKYIKHHKKHFFPTFNEAMAAQILLFNKEIAKPKA